MSWKYTEPERNDYDSQEEYESALMLYESALDDYVQEYIERKRGIC